MDEKGPNQKFFERSAGRTTGAALRWLRSSRDPERPLFLWVHYIDPHGWYAPPAPYSERYRRNPYDGEIAFVDAQIGRLLEALDERGDKDRTLVVVVADHGESLGDHGEAMHGYLLYDTRSECP